MSLSPCSKSQILFPPGTFGRFQDPEIIDFDKSGSVRDRIQEDISRDFRNPFHRLDTNETPKDEQVTNENLQKKVRENTKTWESDRSFAILAAAENSDTHLLDRLSEEESKDPNSHLAFIHDLNVAFIIATRKSESRVAKNFLQKYGANPTEALRILVNKIEPSHPNVELCEYKTNLTGSNGERKFTFLSPDSIFKKKASDLYPMIPETTMDLLINDPNFVSLVNVGKYHLLNAIGNDLETGRRLVEENGADPNFLSKMSTTLFSDALFEGQTAKAFYLRYCGANPNYCPPNQMEYSPFLIAAMSSNENALRILIQLGANPDHHPEGQPHPIVFALKGNNREAADLLERYGSDLNQLDPYTGIPFLLSNSLQTEKWICFSHLLEFVKFDTKYPCGRTFLEIVKEKQLDHLIPLLFKSYLDVYNALNKAIRNRNKHVQDIITSHIDPSRMELLLKTAIEKRNYEFFKLFD